jgi:predicted TIM-barrel fold metal-dependent hydrolase
MNRKYNAIDADAHVLEPGDLWTTYLESKFQDQAPGLRRESNGKEVFRIDNNNFVDLGQHSEEAFALAGGIGMREGHGPTGNSYSDGKKGGFDPHLRIPDMNSEGIDVAFLFPTLGLFLGGIRDTQMAVASYRAYNRWLRDYCSPYPDRLYGIAMIPMRSPDDAVAEIKYASKTLGLRAGMVNPILDSSKPLHHPDNDPVWRAAQDHDMSIAVHAAVSNGVKVLGDDRFTNDAGSGSAVQHCAGHMLEMASAVFSFVMNRVCDKFPKLRVGFMEAGGGWVAGCLDRMDRHFDDIGANDTGLTMRPSEIFRRQCFISFEPVEGTLPLLAEYIGRTNILWATDYPHADGFTGAPTMIKKMPMAQDLVKDVLVTGAQRFYGLA